MSVSLSLWVEYLSLSLTREITPFVSLDGRIQTQMTHNVAVLFVAITLAYLCLTQGKKKQQLLRFDGFL